jgi:hypothetical protein
MYFSLGWIEGHETVKSLRRSSPASRGHQPTPQSPIHAKSNAPSRASACKGLMLFTGIDFVAAAAKVTLLDQDAAPGADEGCGSPTRQPDTGELIVPAN